MGKIEQISFIKNKKVALGSIISIIFSIIMWTFSGIGVPFVESGFASNSDKELSTQIQKVEQRTPGVNSEAFVVDVETKEELDASNKIFKNVKEIKQETIGENSTATFIRVR